MKKSVILIGSVAGLIGVGSYALAQSIFPLYTTALTGNEIVRDEGNPTSAFFKTSLLGAYVNGQAGAGQGNALIGADFGTNLFGRGTSTSSITTGPTFTADRWFAWSGTSTGLTVAKDTTAGDFPSTTLAALEITRTGSGVVQSCVGQDVTTGNSVRFAGQTAEFDFHALAQSGFSAASSQLQAYVVYGTGTDEGAAKMAYTINAGGGGTPGWTNGTVASNPLITISSTLSRFTVAAAIPVTVTTSPVTEVGVALCWTPVGASPSSDAFSFSLPQLVVNGQLTASATTYLTNSTSARPFLRSLANVEAENELAYYQQTSEVASPSAGAAAVYAPCYATSSSTATCLWTFTTRMRAVPTVAYTAGTISASLGTSNAAEAVSGLAIASTGATQYTAKLTLTSSSLSTGVNGYLQSGDSTGGGVIAFSAEP